MDALYPLTTTMIGAPKKSYLETAALADQNSMYPALRKPYRYHVPQRTTQNPGLVVALLMVIPQQMGEVQLRKFDNRNQNNGMLLSANRENIQHSRSRQSNNGINLSHAVSSTPNIDRLDRVRHPVIERFHVENTTEAEHIHTFHKKGVCFLTGYLMPINIVHPLHRKFYEGTPGPFRRQLIATLRGRFLDGHRADCVDFRAPRKIVGSTDLCEFAV